MEEGELPTGEEQTDTEIQIVSLKDIDITIREMLKGSIIFEYPTLNVGFY